MPSMRWSGGGGGWFGEGSLAYEQHKLAGTGCFTMVCAAGPPARAVALAPSRPRALMLPARANPRA